MKYLDEYRSPAILQGQLRAIRELDTSAVLMEVCGTHTMVISRSGLRPLLTPEVDLVSGPGCPVCVTSERDMGRALALASIEDVILATFGDMVRVPGPQGTLLEASSRGAAVKVVYSPLDAVALARENPDRRVVFLGVGFETTAPTVAAAVLRAREEGLGNFFVLSLHKLIPPALKALVHMEDFSIDGFLLPGHVSVVLGTEAYRFLPREHGIPCVISGFEPADILRAVYLLLRMKAEGKPEVANEYSRAVRPEGNRRARETMCRVFREADAEWRGLGLIPGSGLALREEFADLDAGSWEVEVPEVRERSGCRCGDVLCGRIRPTECPLFARSCTPDSPFGPCMVSSEGTCASYYLYEEEGR
ncbi:hydrogenase formation protein HypD [Candidatus Solincola sp.]|nr:hydrogenase formation protein HypD [Actinomycetota bacterium]MDI7252001.1 hydrogenase formation protein HypD [Actinomycetota bacterium]